MPLILPAALISCICKSGESWAAISGLSPFSTSPPGSAESVLEGVSDTLSLALPVFFASLSSVSPDFDTPRMWCGEALDVVAIPTTSRFPSPSSTLTCRQVSLNTGTWGWCFTPVRASSAIRAACSSAALRLASLSSLAAVIRKLLHALRLDWSCAAGVTFGKLSFGSSPFFAAYWLALYAVHWRSLDTTAALPFLLLPFTLSFGAFVVSIGVSILTSPSSTGIVSCSFSMSSSS